MNRIKFFFIRHAQSSDNANKPDIIGQEESNPLSELGVKQAHLLGRRFQNEKIKFDHLFSSTFARAIQTAEIVRSFEPNQNCDFTLSENLREYSPGSWKGTKRSDIYADANKLAKMATLTMGFQYPQGDSLHQVQRRMCSFLEGKIIHNEDILRQLKDRSINIAVVSHGLALKSFMHYVLNFDRNFVWKIMLFNASISKFDYCPDAGWRIHSLNDCGHLEK